jgi:hypothetical protein
VVGTAGNPPETISVYPANYGLSQTYVAATGAAGRGILGFAARQFEASSQDPGTFTLSGSLAWRSATIAVKGAGIGFATASVAVTASASMTLANLSLSGIASVSVRATLNTTLAGITVSGTATSPQPGSTTQYLRATLEDRSVRVRSKYRYRTFGRSE